MTAMLDLAMHGESAPVTLAAISNRNGISQPYLEKLFASLKAGGLVRGVRGASGGYLLMRTAADISVGEVMAAVDRLDATNCGGEKNCRSGAPCLTHNVWVRLNRQVWNCLNDISLESEVAALATNFFHKPGARADGTEILRQVSVQ